MDKELIHGIKEGAELFGEAIAALVNTVLLTIVYFVGIGLTSIIAKIFKKSFLDLDKKSYSYWKNLNLRKKPLEEYYRRF